MYQEYGQLCPALGICRDMSALVSESRHMGEFIPGLYEMIVVLKQQCTFALNRIKVSDYFSTDGFIHWLAQKRSPPRFY